MVEHTQRSLRILFALLYGAELTWEHLATADSSSTLEKLRYLITAGAYAEYLGCLDHITAPVTAIIRSNLSFAYLIPENPQACLLFTKKFSRSVESTFWLRWKHLAKAGAVTSPKRVRGSMVTAVSISSIAVLKFLG